jgi:NhaC family Na+:H+ antiporter
MTSMLELISLIIFAVILGGLFEKLGVLTGILNRMISAIYKKGHLVLVTMVSSIISAMLGCNHFLGVFLPARMIYKKYDKLNVSSAELARALGDSGLIMSPLIPWNVNALMMTAVLGVNTLQYFKFSFLPLLLPISGIIFAFINQD